MGKSSDLKCTKDGKVHDHSPWWKPGKIVGTHDQEKYNTNNKGKK